MSVISDHLAKQQAFNVRQGNSIDSLVGSIDGLAGDIKKQADLIKALQDSAGSVTPEDQIIINELESNGETISGKFEALATAAKALDDMTDPVPPPVP